MSSRWFLSAFWLLGHLGDITCLFRNGGHGQNISKLTGFEIGFKTGFETSFAHSTLERLHRSVRADNDVLAVAGLEKMHQGCSGVARGEWEWNITGEQQS